MTIDLLYGRSGLGLAVPEGVQATVVRKHPMPVLADPTGAVNAALDRPVLALPLEEEARGKKSACILICDITRPVPNAVLLPPLVARLERAGIVPENIVVLVATGLHRPNENEELAEVVGATGLMGRVRIENHFARDRAAHVELGRTSTGIPIAIDRRFVQADMRIVVGLVEPHFMAGYSGGRKLVAPGIAYQDTILHLHTAALLDHPRAANCILDGNPLHAQQLEIVAAVGAVRGLNVVIDEARRIGFVNYGDILASHEAAVAFIRPYAEVRLPRRFATVVTTSAGYPLDKTYYQTIKGMVGVLDIVEPGGLILIASRCAEGMGSAEFIAAQRELCRLGPEGFMDQIMPQPTARIDAWQTQMLVKALRVARVGLFTTGLKPDDIQDTGVAAITSIEAAVRDNVRAAADPHVAIVPEGPYVIPRLESGDGAAR